MSLPSCTGLLSALLCAALLCSSVELLRAGDVDADWSAIVQLDAGPKSQPKSREEAQAATVAHLAAQEKALRGFLAGHPGDVHVFEARLRLARLLQIRADFEQSAALRQESGRILAELEKTVTPEQLPELEFAKISRLMRGLRSADSPQRSELLVATRKFQSAFPDDRRLAALLTEVATLFDLQPKTKEALLSDAQGLPADEELKGRIADDLKRVRLLGQLVVMSSTTTDGRPVNLEAFRGKPLILIFCASFSPPSAAAITTVQRAVKELPKGSVQLLGVSLDDRPELAAALRKEQGISWPLVCDGKGWESPVIRALGINTLPTVWLLDDRGRLRSLNALQSTAAQLRQLLNSR
jgi:peroxiredoxin